MSNYAKIISLTLHYPQIWFDLPPQKKHNWKYRKSIATNDRAGRDMLTWNGMGKCILRSTAWPFQEICSHNYVLKAPRVSKETTGRRDEGNILQSDALILFSLSVLCSLCSKSDGKLGFKFPSGQVTSLTTCSPAVEEIILISKPQRIVKMKCKTMDNTLRRGWSIGQTPEKTLALQDQEDKSLTLH